MVVVGLVSSKGSWSSSNSCSRLFMSSHSLWFASGDRSLGDDIAVGSTSIMTVRAAWMMRCCNRLCFAEASGLKLEDGMEGGGEDEFELLGGPHAVGNWVLVDSRIEIFVEMAERFIVVEACLSAAALRSRVVAACWVEFSARDFVVSVSSAVTVSRIDACLSAVALRSRVVAACWVELAVRNLVAAVSSLVMLSRWDLTLLATARARTEEILSVTSSSSRKAAARIADDTSGASFGVSETVNRMLTILNRS